MAFTIPTAIADFFGRYPAAKPVYVLADNTAYINHYNQKALEVAKKSGQRLYEVDSATTYQQVYPAFKTCSAIVKNPALTAYCNDQTLEIPDGEVSGNVKTAFSMVAEEAGIVIDSITVSVHETLYWKIIITSEEAEFSCEQDGGDIINFTVENP